MVFNFNEFESRIIKSLGDSGLIDNFSIDDISKNPDISFIIEIFKYPSKLDFDDDGLFFLNGDGDKIYCPEIRTSISDKGEWLSDKLPPVGFDIDQSGNVRKANEAEALYCCTIVSHIIKEESFKSDLDAVAVSYDFNDMKPFSDNLKSFRELLNEWQALQSVIINIIVSASKFRLSDNAFVVVTLSW